MGSHTFRVRAKADARSTIRVKPATTYRADVQAVLDSVRHIVHALRESSRWAEQHLGLSGAQLFVLQALAASPAASVNDLAVHTHTHQSSVSTVVSKLVARGLVRRVRSEVDGRTVELSLSARGKRIAASIPDLPQQRLIRSIEQLSPTRLRQLASALASLAHALDAPESAPAMFFEDGARALTTSRRHA